MRSGGLLGRWFGVSGSLASYTRKAGFLPLPGRNPAPLLPSVQRFRYMVTVKPEMLALSVSLVTVMVLGPSWAVTGTSAAMWVGV